MRNNFNSRDNESDLEKTIQFTADDLKKLRSPNRQPLDGDYFTNNQFNEDDVDDENWQEEFSDDLDAESENIYYDEDDRVEDAEVNPLGKAVDWDYGYVEDFEADDDSQMGDWDNDSYEEQAEVEVNEDAPADENPFVYHSIQNRLRESIEKEKYEDLKEKEERKKNSFFNTLFSSDNQVKYSTQKIDDLDDYNQFDESDDEDFDESLDTFVPEYNEADVTIDESYEEEIYDQVSAASSDFQMDDFIEEEAANAEVNSEEKAKPSFFSRLFNRNRTEVVDEQDDFSGVIEVPQEDSDTEVEFENDDVAPMDEAIQEDLTEDESVEEEIPEEVVQEASTEAEVVTQQKLPRKASKGKNKKKRKHGKSAAKTEVAPAPMVAKEEVDAEINPTSDEIIAEENQVDESQFEEVAEIIEAAEVNEVKDKDLKKEAKEFGEKVSQATAHYQEPLITDASLNEMRGQEDIVVENKMEDQAENRFAKGAAWLSIGNIVSRIIGALYVIPWASMLGANYTRANTLYSVGYKPYSLFLAVATAGFPSAIAKQMSFYHSKKEYRVADKLFKNSMYIMLLTGLVSSLILFFAAPFLAGMSATDNPAAGAIVIRSLAPALLILPAMSLLRGYFQGFDDMIPTAVSQILEQFVRVIYLLVATYAVMEVMKGTATTAVAHSTFAAFVGALISLLYLVFIYFRKRPLIKELMNESENRIDLDFKQSAKIMVMDSIPFVILGSGIILAQIIDTYSFRQIIQATSTMLLSDISELYGVLSLDVDKLVMIIISLAIAIASSSVPSVTSLFAQKDYPRTSRLIQNIVTVFSFIMLPAAVGLASIANNMYFFFYPLGNEQGPTVLILGAYLSIVLGAYTILSTVLQSMNFRRIAVRYLLIGLVLKVILQFPFVALLHANGAQLATLFAFLITTVLMWIKIHSTIIIDYVSLAKDLVVIVASTALMGISTSLWNTVFDMMFGPVGRLLTFVKIMLVVLIGMLVYLGIMALFGKLDILIGNRYKNLQDKMQVFY
ncbi:oligosaccharide flippase family protein [Fundicoccus sp. Sow4_H7]|uniref:putative polysaccharide biosynthesis protein n=1 Tax=Fundicoccus sp. Sow4_H7 TaxID=3438784 RepID=UPI003F924879